MDTNTATCCYVSFTNIISQICSLHTQLKGPKKANKISCFYRDHKNLMRKRAKLRRKVINNPSISIKIMSIEKAICTSHNKEKLFDGALAVTKIKSDPNYFFRFAKKFSICKSSICPILNPKSLLLTNDKSEMGSLLLDQFNSVFLFQCQT